jgi:ABC-2 type transport system ATP-binding protein
VDNLLTGEENMRLMADLRHLGRDPGRRRIAELLDRFDLLDAARKSVATYSGGMKRRLDLAMTLLGEPRLIFLDEPTTGLDPRSRRTMWDVIAELVAGGVTIFLTTQYLDEADRLADLIAILDGGRIVAQGSPDELKRNLPGGHIQLQFADTQSMGSAARLLDSDPGDPKSLTLQVAGDSSVPSVRALLDRLDHAGIRAERLSIHEADLDDVFLALTGRPTAELELQP